MERKELLKIAEPFHVKGQKTFAAPNNGSVWTQENEKKARDYARRKGIKLEVFQDADFKTDKTKTAE